MKRLPSITLIALLCLACTFAHATVFLPVFCVDKSGNEIDCPAHDPRPAVMNNTSKRNFLKHLEDVFHEDYIADLRNDRYRVLLQPRWIADTESGEGDCITEVHYYDLENYALRSVREYYHVRMSSEDECQGEFDRMKAAKQVEPFESKKRERVICDDPTPSRCHGAANMFSYFAKLGVEKLMQDTRITIIDAPPSSEQWLYRFWSSFIFDQGYGPAGRVLVDEKYLGSFLGGIACAKSSGWMICYTEYAPDDAHMKYFVFGNRPSAY